MYINVRTIPEEGLYQLIDPIIIDGVLVPKGFKWNGASIPSFLWMVIGSPFEPRFMVPSMVHDYLYSNGSSIGWTRLSADQNFKKLLIAEGVDEERAETMFTGVRVGGSHFWRD